MLPPGPRSALLATHGFAFDPVGAARGWEARYGKVVSIPLLSGLTIQISDPEHVRDLFQAPAKAFRPGIPEPLDVVTGKRSLLHLGGGDHQRERKLLAPAFRGCKIDRWAEVIFDLAERKLAAVSGEFRALDLAQDTTLEVILRVVFGLGDGALAPMHAAVVEMIDAAHPSILFTRLTQRDMLGLSPWRRFRLASEAVDRMLYEQIARVRAELETDAEAGPLRHDSTLALMLGGRYEDGSAMDDQTARDELRTLLLAGHETSANVLAWALFYLYRDRPLLTRLRAELDTVDPSTPTDYLRLPLLGAVVQETLRIRPSAESCFRRLAEPYRLGPWTIPAGATLAPSILLIHHDPELYPAPERFVPERFLDRQPPAHEFLPFGGGTRRCIGATFARFEASLVLAAVVRRAELEPLDSEVGYGRENMTLGPLGGVRMRRLADAKRLTVVDRGRTVEA